MDTAVALPASPAATPPDATEVRQRGQYVLAALKTAIAEPGEHRLFQSGKLPGLFPTRSGASAAAALDAISAGWLVSVRTETHGKFVVEWVKATVRGVDHLHSHDSPKALLEELQETLNASKHGLPGWLVETRHQLESLSANFEDRSRQTLGRLAELGRRLETALLRIEAQGPSVSTDVAKAVPWAVDALAYLDRRSLVGAPPACPLGELFEAVGETRPDISIPDFHDGLRRLHDHRAVRLNADVVSSDAAEYALLVGHDLCTSVGR